MSDNRVRNFAFTDYVLDKEFYLNLKDKFTYLVIGDKICPSIKKQHWQGFLVMKERMSEKAMIKMLQDGRRIREMYKDSSPLKNKIYCSKDGKLVLELGEVPKGAGARTDLDKLKEMIIEKKTPKEIFEEQPGNFIRYNKGISAAMCLYQEKRNWEMDVRIYWGKPGSGKTRSVHDEFGENLYVKMNNKWWDGYAGETAVVFDDFDPENCFSSTFDWYLKLLDRYNMKIETKGGSCEFRSKTIIFTSNFDPKEWFVEKPNRAAFFRRVNLVKKF